MQTQPTATHHGVGSAIHKADYCSRGAVIGMGTQVVHTTSVLSTRSIFALQMTEDSIWTILDVTAVFQIVGRSPDGKNGYQEDCIMSVVKAAAHSTFPCMASEVNSVSTRRSPVFWPSCRSFSGIDIVSSVSRYWNHRSETSTGLRDVSWPLNLNASVWERSLVRTTLQGAHTNPIRDTVATCDPWPSKIRW